MKKRIKVKVEFNPGLFLIFILLTSIAIAANTAQTQVIPAAVIDKEYLPNNSYLVYFNTESGILDINDEYYFNNLETGSSVNLLVVKYKLPLLPLKIIICKVDKT